VHGWVPGSHDQVVVLLGSASFKLHRIAPTLLLLLGTRSVIVFFCDRQITNDITSHQEEAKSKKVSQIPKKFTGKAISLYHTCRHLYFIIPWVAVTYIQRTWHNFTLGLGLPWWCSLWFTNPWIFLPIVLSPTTSPPPPKINIWSYLLKGPIGKGVLRKGY
jgi:hypothetical protein